MIDTVIDRLIVAVPKCELHVHIEGTLEPEMMMDLAARNRVHLPWPNIGALQRAYDFSDLQSFLDVYYRGADVLRTEQDFADLMWAYLVRAHHDGVRHAEIFFDPQTHTHRGIDFPVFMAGFRSAIGRARARFGMSADLILCFLRHLPPDDALATLDAAERHLEGVVAVGLDSSERGNPPHLWSDAFARARAMGLRAVAHAAEEGPPSYITGALDALGAERIDHGVRALEDPAVVARLRDESIPLTVCPLSNVRLRGVDRIEHHPIRRLIDEGLVVTVNSDDPAYFGGYVTDNYRALVAGLGFDASDIVTMARNSVDASFLSATGKADLHREIAGLAPPS